MNLLTEELGIQVEVVIGPAQILYPSRKNRKRDRRTPSFVLFPKKPSNMSRLYKKRCFGFLGLFSQ